MGGVFHVLALLPKAIRFCAASRFRGEALIVVGVVRA